LYNVFHYYLPKKYNPQSERNVSCFSFHAVYKLDMWKFTELSYNIAEGIVIVQCSLHLCQWLSSTFKTRTCIPGKNCCPFSAATCAWCFAVPCHWHNGILTGFLQDEAGDNLMVQGECCSSVLPKFIVSFCGATHVCSVVFSWRSNTS
jgi:hypothetical protein